LTLSSKGSPQEASQSGQGSSRDSNTSISCRDQGGGGGADLHVRLAVKDDSSIKTPIADMGPSSLPKTELIPGSHRVFNS